MTRKIMCALLALLMVFSCTLALAEDHGPLWIGDYDLTYWIPLSDGQAQHFTTLAEHPYFLWMEEQTGVHVEFIHPSWEQMDQQFNLMMTSNNFYDLIYYIEYTDGPQASIDDGVFVDLNLYKEYMPDYYEALYCDDGSFAAWEWGTEKELYNPQPAARFVDRTMTVNGNMWCMTQVFTDDYPTECGGIIRQDWLDDAGLSMPQTIEDLEKALAAFKARGEDVIPMTLGTYGYNSGSGFLVSAYDIYPAWWTVTGTEVDPHAYTTPEMKEYLTLMNKWFDLGYIDPDFMNRDYDTQLSLMLQDKLGIIADNWNTPEYIESLYGGEDPDFNVSAMPLPRMSTDQQLHWKMHYDSAPILWTCITTTCDIPEVAAQWLNVFYTKEGILRATYGEEGVSYVLDEETGAPYYTEWYYNNPDGLDTNDINDLYLFGNSSGYYSTRAALIPTADKETIQTTLSDWQQACNVWGANADYSKVIGYVNFPGDGWSEMHTPYTEADTYAAPMLIKFITGDEPLDKFDEFAQNVLDMGMAEARDKTQEAYSAMFK